MKILVIGSNGFVGKNLIAELNNQGYTEILEFGKDTDITLLDTRKEDMVNLFWASEIFYKDKPDAYYLEVRNL